MNKTKEMDSMKINQMTNENEGPEIQKHKSYLGQNVQIVQKLQSSVKNISALKKIWETLCTKCKNKALQNPQMDLSLYCETCRNKVTPMLEALSGRLK